VAHVIERNIRTLLIRYYCEVQQGGWPKRLADAITRFTGSMAFVYLHLLLFGGWIIANLPGVLLAMALPGGMRVLSQSRIPQEERERRMDEQTHGDDKSLFVLLCYASCSGGS